MKRKAGVRTLLALVVFSSMVGGVTGTAAPAAARAATVAVYCFDVFNLADDEIERECIEIPLVIHRERCCPQFHLRLAVDLRDPADRHRFVAEVTAGLHLMVQAEVEGEPRLRAAATERFLVAARILGSPDVRFTVAGPEPEPWLESAGTGVAEGITLAWQSAAGPQPEPWREQALASLDRALRALRYQAVVG